MIKVSGTTLPSPETYKVGFQDINKAERNALGTMVIERIATKRKIELAWGVLNQDETSLILGLVAPAFFSVTYLDPLTKGNRTANFYAGDRVAPVIVFEDGVPFYSGLKFNLIEL